MLHFTERCFLYSRAARVISAWILREEEFGKFAETVDKGKERVYEIRSDWFMRSAHSLGMRIPVEFFTRGIVDFFMFGGRSLKFVASEARSFLVYRNLDYLKFYK